MATPGSRVATPSFLSLGENSHNNNHNHNQNDNPSILDFLNFSPNPPNASLGKSEESTTSSHSIDFNGYAPQSLQENEAGPSSSLSLSSHASTSSSTNTLKTPGGTITSGHLHQHQSGGYAPSEGSIQSRRNSIESKRSPSGRGKLRSSIVTRKTAQNGISNHDEMDVDGNPNSEMSSMEGIIENSNGMFGLQNTSNSSSSSGGFDPSGFLQQQLESIHVQSPFLFGENGSTNSPYAALGGIFMSSPNHNGQQSGNAFQQSMQVSSSTGNDRAAQNGQAQWIGGLGGMITPGPSGEMYPQLRPDMMSPMQLEMLAKAQGMEGMDFNVPLLSPALSQQNPSAYASPANQSAFHQNYMPSPLEALQVQQRQFQEQLALLQEQQKQLQATAAAVAAASSVSPYMPPSHHQQQHSNHSSQPSSGHTRPATTPGTGPHGNNREYFSPLTSPALEATRNNNQYHNNHSFSPAFGPSRTVAHPGHPLSALSSPALNPIGSSGGAQQTLSPALRPQDNTDLGDPDYIRALVGMLENQNQGQNQNQNQNQNHNHNYNNQGGLPPNSLPGSAFASPMINHHHSSTTPSPLAGAAPGQAQVSGSSSGGPGPNRNSLPPKTRPSPMIKPTHRSKQPSLPNSPLIPSRYNPIPMTPMNAFNLNPNSNTAGVQLHQISQGSNTFGGSGIQYMQPQSNTRPSSIAGSTASTPSPVDLSQIMPPPPVPKSAMKGITPMTPASLMNLGNNTGFNAIGAGPSGSSSNASGRKSVGSAPQISVDMGGPVAGSTKKQTAVKGRKSNSAVMTTPVVAGTKRGGAASKQKLASKPGGVGVRAATKAAAAAASLHPPEGETRKTSHKAAEQKRRDSLKAGFDELRLLLPPINTEALDPESGEPIPGSSAPRLLPKSSLVPDDNPNRGVSKVALLKFSNEYIVTLVGRVGKRDEYIEKLRMEVLRLRRGIGGEGGMDMMDEGDEAEEGEDLLSIDITEGEDEFGQPPQDDEEEEEEENEGGEGEEEEEDGSEDEGENAGMNGDGEYMDEEMAYTSSIKKDKRNGVGKSPALKATRPGISRSGSSSGTVKGSIRRG